MMTNSDEKNGLNKNSKKATWKNNVEKALKFHLDEVTSWEKFQDLMFQEKDGSSLAVLRILYGLLMFLDIPDERGLSSLEQRWGSNDECKFPLIHFLQPLPYHWMCILYSIMWLGTIGIMIGFKFHTSCLAFCIPYWYVVLLDKTAWNNHTYMFGLLGILFFVSNANACWSIDSWMYKGGKRTVPLWNYVIFRYQVFMVYFLAGVKKMNSDWLGGHSMISLSKHMVFSPFRIFLTDKQIDYWMIHVVGCSLDTLAGFGLYFDKLRPITFVFLLMFNGMNSRMFAIGMFSYMLIVTMFIFCDTDWPKKLLCPIFKTKFTTKKPSHTQNRPDEKVARGGKNRKTIIIIFMFLYMFQQMFMPFSHFITQGYNNGWTNGLYGYSWDMMVYNWETSITRIKVVNGNDGQEFFLEDTAWVQTDKWTRHPDMVIQYATCLQERLLQKQPEYFRNISIYMDIWSSLNGRAYQRMYDPRVDLLTAYWNPFKRPTWTLPLITEFTPWRATLNDIHDEILARANVTTISFYADFPGLYLENYVSLEMQNVTLTILEGIVRLIYITDQCTELYPGDDYSIQADTQHIVQTVSKTPSCFMYTYANSSRPTDNGQEVKRKPLHLALYDETSNRFYRIKKAIGTIYTTISNLTAVNTLYL